MPWSRCEHSSRDGSHGIAAERNRPCIAPCQRLNVTATRQPGSSRSRAQPDPESRYRVTRTSPSWQGPILRDIEPTRAGPSQVSPCRRAPFAGYPACRQRGTSQVSSKQGTIMSRVVHCDSRCRVGHSAIPAESGALQRILCRKPSEAHSVGVVVPQHLLVDGEGALEQRLGPGSDPAFPGASRQPGEPSRTGRPALEASSRATVATNGPPRDKW